MIGDIGIFNPAEGQYKTPGAYDEALRADALKRATYLSMMDQFYEQLDETKREFDATSTFKYAELAQSKWATEEQIGLSKEDLALRRELGTGDQALRSRALDEQAAYNKEALSVERMKINASRPTQTLGGTSAADKAFDFLRQYTTAGGGGYRSVEGTPIESLSMTGGRAGAQIAAPTSGQVDYGSSYTPEERDQMSWL
jgi:hypothetical protein